LSSSNEGRQNQALPLEKQNTVDVRYHFKYIFCGLILIMVIYPILLFQYFVYLCHFYCFHSLLNFMPSDLSILFIKKMWENVNFDYFLLTIKDNNAIIITSCYFVYTFDTRPPLVPKHLFKL